MADNDIGFVWIYALVVLFVLGIIELLILPAVETQFIPPMIASMNQTSPGDVAAFIVQVNNVVGFIDKTMYVLMFVIVIYMIIMIFKKEEKLYQQY